MRVGCAQRSYPGRSIDLSPSHAFHMYLRNGTRYQGDAAASSAVDPDHFLKVVVKALENRTFGRCFAVFQGHDESFRHSQVSSAPNRLNSQRLRLMVYACFTSPVCDACSNPKKMVPEIRRGDLNAWHETVCAAVPITPRHITKQKNMFCRTISRFEDAPYSG